MIPDEYFKRIGVELAQRWDEGEFPYVAAGVLNEIAPPEDLTFESISEWALGLEELPKQVNFHSGFGAPPLVVYADEDNRFYVELLVWFSSRTAIHGHGFSGAFRVLGGYSIQCSYAYQGDELCEGVKQGELTPVGLDFLSPGHVSLIEKDEGFIHSVIHMGKPSLTLVVRTPSDGSTKHQYQYFRNGFALASFRRSESQTRQAQMLRALRAVNPDAFEPAVLRYLESGDLHRLALAVLSSLAPELKSDPELLLKVREMAVAKFGEDVGIVFSAFDEASRADVLWALINGSDRPDLQLLTSLRELIPLEGDLHRLLKKSHPSQTPEELLESWEEQTLRAVG